MKQDQEIAWILIAKSLAGEASPAEIRRLETLLRDNAELHYPTQIITHWWNCSAEPDSDEVEKALSRHREHLLRQCPDFEPPD